MSKALVLSALRPDFAVVAPIGGGVFVRPAPAVELALLMAESEDLSDALERPNDVFADDEFFAHCLDPKGLRPVLERLVTASLQHLDEGNRSKLVASRGADFMHLVVAAVSASLPRDVSSLFRKRKTKDGWQTDPDPDDIAGDLFKAATRLQAAGYADAFSMSWTRLSFAAAIEAEREADQLERFAVGTRVGGADAKGWDKFQKGLGR